MITNVITEMIICGFGGWVIVIPLLETQFLFLILEMAIRICASIFDFKSLMYHM